MDIFSDLEVFIQKIRANTYKRTIGAHLSSLHIHMDCGHLMGSTYIPKHIDNTMCNVNTYTC